MVEASGSGTLYPKRLFRDKTRLSTSGVTDTSSLESGSDLLEDLSERQGDSRLTLSGSGPPFARPIRPEMKESSRCDDLDEESEQTSKKPYFTVIATDRSSTVNVQESCFEYNSEKPVKKKVPYSPAGPPPDFDILL